MEVKTSLPDITASIISSWLSRNEPYPNTDVRIFFASLPV
jgi:hypothetical protein